MRKESNPYSIGFGIKPLEYIKQNLIIDEIIDEFNEKYVQHPCYMLSGVRGCGKTVTMVSIGDALKKDSDWIVIRLNPESELMEELVAKLYDANDFIMNFINKEINLSGFGIGISIESVSPAASLESALIKIMNVVKKKNKRLLVLIDEVSNTKQIRSFAHTFQTLLGEELPIFLLMTGLHKNIKNLQDESNCTFLYRAEEIILEPLNCTLMKKSYEKALNIDTDLAWNMAVLTKGYPVAYQIVGKYMWELDKKEITDEYLEHVDAALERYVYRKIWSELSAKDKWFLSFICRKDKMDVSEILELSKQKKNEFSQYRERLSEKGILNTKIRGVVSLALPRFDVFTQKMVELEDIGV